MGANSSIQWTNSTWTPIRGRLKPDALEIAKRKGYTSLVQLLEKRGIRRKDGELRVGPHCEHASPGCHNCYSETNNGRCLPHNGTGLPFDRRSRDLLDFFVDEKILTEPLRWRKPRVIFVCSQTDLYGEWMTDEMIDQVKAVEALCPQHFFLELTKHPERAECYSVERNRAECIEDQLDYLATYFPRFHLPEAERPDLPLENVGLGVSVENGDYLWRIEKLLQVPAALRFVSAEPLLAHLSLAGWVHVRQPDDSMPLIRVPGTSGFLSRIDWVIAGGESGSKARPCNLSWIRSLRDQCGEAGVPFFLKQLGSRPMYRCTSCPPDYPSQCHMYGDQDGHGDDGMLRLYLKSSKGGNLLEWPSGLQDCREWPEVLNGWGIAA